MKRNRLLLLATLIMGLAAIGQADTFNDPHIIVGGGNNNGSVGLDTISVFGNSFSFISPSGSSPATSPCVSGEQRDIDCTFINMDRSGDFGVTWTSLTFQILPNQPGLTCDPGPFFAECGIDSENGIVTFTGGSGIPFGAEFQMIVDGFLPNTEFDATANVPEPATLILLVTGVGAFIRRRRRS